MNRVNFRYQPPTAGDHAVGILAEFTNWAIIPLENVQGIYQKEFWLQPGLYQYKLIVDGTWMPDPENPELVSDAFGGCNSVINIQEESTLTDISLLPYFQEIPFNMLDDFPVPEWVKSGIIYQILPDRFCNGNPVIDPDFSEWFYADSHTPPPPSEFLAPQQEYFHLISDWNDISGLKQSKYLPQGKPDWWCFYGGDLAGVKQQLPYLIDLGITIIYFNPLWQSKSNHKYDAADFMKIDPHFGTEVELKELIKTLHYHGIKVVLDVALNHTGETFWAFRDCVQKGEASEYWHWYDWHQWPLPSPLPDDFQPKDYYQCWWGIKDMPDLNYDLSRQHPAENEVKDITDAVPNWQMIRHLQEVIKMWLIDMDIDGFRLDVPNEVPYWFWQLIRLHVKSLKSDAWLVGEIWTNPHSWVSDTYFDSVMNYAHFKDPVIEYFIQDNLDTISFVQKLYYGLTEYPRSSCFAMMNLLGSHDTWRLMEIAQGDISKVKLAVLFQMTYIGAPHVYYGDEIGMAGAHDPDNRRPFDWDWEQSATATELHSYYKELIQLRQKYNVLQKGLIRFLHHPQLLIYLRYLDDEEIITVINNTSLPVKYSQPNDCQILFQSNCGSSVADNKTILMLPFSAVICKTTYTERS